MSQFSANCRKNFIQFLGIYSIDNAGVIGENEYMQSNPQTIFSWEAPLRAYKKQSKGVLRFYLALALLLSLIVFFWGEKILVLPIWAMLFLFYTLTITKPPIVKNSITRFGLTTDSKTFRFDHLSYFYITNQFDYYMLVVVSQPPLSYHIYFVIPDEEVRDRVIEILSDYLIYQEHPRRTFTDKMIGVLSSLMPSDREFVE